MTVSVDIMNVEFQFVRTGTHAVVARGVWAGRLYYSNIAQYWVFVWATNVSAFSDVELYKIRQAAKKMQVILNITARLKGL